MLRSSRNEILPILTFGYLTHELPLKYIFNSFLLIKGSLNKKLLNIYLIIVCRIVDERDEGPKYGHVGLKTFLTLFDAKIYAKMFSEFFSS